MGQRQLRRTERDSVTNELPGCCNEMDCGSTRSVSIGFTNKRDCRCVNVAAKEKDACENLLNQLRIHVNAGRSILLVTVCLPAGDLEH